MSPETRRLLNPPFLAAILASAAAGFLDEAEDGLPLLYSFVVPPMVLHKDTRERLPKVVTSKMPAWAQHNASVLAHLPEHMSDLQQLIRHSLIVGYNMGLLVFDSPNRVTPAKGITPETLSAIAKQSAEVPDIFKRSHFLGRWLSTAGNPPTVFSVLGIGLNNATV